MVLCAVAAEKVTENCGDEWGLISYTRPSICVYTAISTWIYPQKLVIATEAPIWKLSSHGIFPTWSRAQSQFAQE